MASDPGRELSIECVDDGARLPAVAGDWQRLLARSASDVVFLTWDWLEAWWRCLRGDCRLRLLVARDARSEPVAMAPLGLTAERGLWGRPVRCLHFLGDRAAGSEYLDFIVARGQESAALAAMLRFLDEDPAWDVLRLRSVPVESPSLPLIAGWAARRGFPLLQDRVTCSAIPLPPGWDTYLRTLRPRFRTALRSKTRWLLEARGGEVLEPAGEREIEASLEAMFALHQDRWARVGKPGSFGAAAKRDFYRLVARRFADRGWLRFHVLRVDGEILAAQFGLAYRGVLYHLQEGTSLANPSWSPGNVLRARVLERLVTEGFTAYDFLGGLSAHKLRWGARPREAADVIVSRRRLVPFLSTRIPYWRRRTGRRVRSLLAQRAAL